ncbi:MAG: hypothetical protein H0U69_06235 [Trueperaceae bacterium]|nr:hypothetical protein [Trueperaceae bacterium]
MRNERRPAWLVDLKWMSALVLVACAAVATLAAGAARVTQPASGEPLARQVLMLVLGPSGDDVEVTVGARGYQAGRPLAILPGVDAFVDPSELDAFAVDEAVSRVAGVLTERVLVDGTLATWALVEDDALRGQLEALDTTTLRPLANAALQRALLGVGLDNGTRAANWPAQAAQNPGQDVQPLVGIVVLVPPSEITGRTHRQVGERVIDGLATVLMDEGAARAQAVVTNSDVAEAFEAAIDGSVRGALHAAFETSIATRRGEITLRLAEARAVASGARRSDDPWAGVLDEAEALGLSGEERRDRVQIVLARRALSSGSAGVLELVQDAAVAQRVSAAAAVVDGIGRSAHGRYLAWAWAGGLAALVFIAVLVLVTQGPGRALWPGVCLLAAAGPGLVLALVWRDGMGGGAWPAGNVAEGAIASLWGTLRLLSGSLAPVAAERIYWVYLLVAGTGAALVLVGVAAWIGSYLRPRRRTLI